MKICRLLTAGFASRVPAGSHFEEYSRTIMRFNTISHLMDYYQQHRGETHSYFSLTSRAIARIMMKGTADIDLAQLDKWMGPNYEIIMENIGLGCLTMQDLRDIVSLVQRRQLFDFDPKHYGQIYQLLQCCIERLRVEQVTKNEYFLINCIQLAHISNHMGLRERFMELLSLSIPQMCYVSTKKVIAVSMVHFLPRQMDYRLLLQLHSCFMTGDAELVNIVLNQLVYLRQRLHLGEQLARWMDEQSERVAGSLQTIQLKEVWMLLNRCLAHDIGNPICREMFAIFISQLHPNGELGASPALFLFIISRMVTQSSFYMQLRYPDLPTIFISLFKRYFFGREKPVLGLCYRKVASRTLIQILFDYNTSRLLRQLLEKCGRGNVRDTVLEHLSNISTQTTINIVQMNIQGLFDLHREVIQMMKPAKLGSVESLSSVLLRFNQIHPYLTQSNRIESRRYTNFWKEHGHWLYIRLIQYKIRWNLQMLILPEESVMEILRQCISELSDRLYHLECCVLDLIRRHWSQYLSKQILLEMSKCNVAPILLKLLYNGPQKHITTTMQHFILRYFELYAPGDMPRVLQDTKLIQYVYLHRQDIFLNHLEHILTHQTPPNINHQLNVIRHILHHYQLVRNPQQIISNYPMLQMESVQRNNTQSVGQSVPKRLKALYKLDSEGVSPHQPIFAEHIEYLMRNIVSNREREILLLLLFRLQIYHPLLEIVLLFPLLNSTKIINPSQFLRIVSHYPLQRPESMLMNQLSIYLKDISLHLPYAMTIYSAVTNPTHDMQLVIKLLKLKGKREQFTIQTLRLYDVVGRGHIAHKIYL